VGGVSRQRMGLGACCREPRWITHRPAMARLADQYCAAPNASGNTNAVAIAPIPIAMPAIAP
jgi:hypothetical protein